MANKWIPHVMKTMKMMKKKGTYAKGKGLAQVIKEAKKTWKKGGAVEPEKPPVEPEVLPTGEVKEEPVTSETPASEEGGRRRRRGSKKTRRARKH